MNQFSVDMKQAVKRKRQRVEGKTIDVRTPIYISESFSKDRQCMRWYKIGCSDKATLERFLERINPEWQNLFPGEKNIFQIPFHAREKAIGSGAIPIAEEKFNQLLEQPKCKALSMKSMLKKQN